MPLLKTWIGSLLANIGSLGFGLATGILGARLLLPTGRGELAEIVFWATTVGALGLFAIPTALTVAIARDPQDKTLPANGLTLSLTLGLASALIFLLVGDYFVRDPKIMAFVCVFVPLYCLCQNLVSLEQGYENFARYNLLRLVPQGGYLAGMLVLWACGIATPMNIALALLCGVSAIMPIHFLIARRQIAWRIRLPKSMGLLRLGSGFHLGSLSSILLQRADQFVLVTWFSHQSLGIYSVAMTASGVGVGLVSGATLTILVPRLARADSLSDQRQKIRTALGLTLIATIVINAAMAIVAPWIIPVAFGAAFAPASSIVAILCAAQIPLTYVTVASIALRTLGDWQTGVVGPLGALVVFALAALWFVPRLGVDGVAMAVVLAWAAAFLYVVYQVSRRLQLSIRDCLIPPMDKPALAYRAMVSSAIFRDATFFSIFRKSL